MDQIEVNLALLNGLSKENQMLRQELRDAHEVIAALCFQSPESLHLRAIDFLHTRDATLTVERTIEGDWFISAKRKT